MLNKLKFPVAMALLTATFLGQPSFAQDNAVILNSPDGTATLQGDLMEFDGEFYTVRTNVGIFRVSVNKVACAGPGCPTQGSSVERTIFAGSETLGLGLMPLLLQGYASNLEAGSEIVETQLSDEVAIKIIADDGFGDEIGEYMVKSTSSGQAFRALKDKTAQIGLASRRITPKEVTELRNLGAGDMISPQNERVIAVESLAVIVNPSNPIDTLSLEQLAGIYSGRIINWSQVGGADLPITALTRDENTGARAEFDTTVLIPTNQSVAPSIRAISSNSEMSMTVNDDPSAIGFVGFAFQRGAKPVNIANACGITVAPTTFSAKTEEYPLGQRLYMYSRSDNLTKKSQDFLDFATSLDADNVIEKAGFIDLGVERIGQDFTGTRMQDVIRNTTVVNELDLMRELLVDMLVWDRLSTTLRFRSGSTTLDEKAKGDVRRLIEYLAKQPDGTEVAIVGFSDSDGGFAPNRQLSLRRAEQAADTILQSGADRLTNVSFISKGFGELSPTACNTSLVGKAVNRRVELWVRTPT